MVLFLADEAERPAVHKLREHFRLQFHQDSKTMKAFEHGEDEDRMTSLESTELDPDADLPFPGLDAPLGG